MSVDEIRLELPIRGIEAKDWVANYFVAHQEGDQIRDYRGRSKTYPGHKGTDFNIPNFRFMDRGVSVYASASGRVVDTHDGEPDRNTSRRRHEGYGNYVEIRHPNGFTSIYGHLKNGSISVERGQCVDVGRRIGAVGSSGRSDGPHLHFELRDRDGCCVDPSQEGYWINPPEYDPPFSIMDLSVQKGIENLVRTRAPTMENTTSFFCGEWITVGVFLAGLRAEEISIGMQVGSRRCVKVLGSDTRIENQMIFWAPFCFLERGRGSIVVFKDRAPIPGCELEVNCVRSQ